MTSSLVYGEPSHPDRIKYPRRVARRHDARLGALLNELGRVNN